MSPPLPRPELPGDPARRLVAALAGSGWTLATGESLTAGLVTDGIARVPGASMVLRGGVTAYQVAVKESVLGVGRELIAQEGVVSGEVALALARGARRLLGADLGIGTTGVAGPGPADDRPAGTVVVAVVLDGVACVRRWALAGSRARVREAAAGLAIGLAAGVVLQASGRRVP